MEEEPARFRDEEVRRRPVAAAVAAALPPAPDGPGQSGAANVQSPRAPQSAALIPPGFGSSPRGRARRGGRGQRGPSHPGRVPPPPGPGAGRSGPPGGGRGGGPPPHGSKSEARLKEEARRQERRAALFKRQVASMEVSPSMLARPDGELRESLLRSGPDVAPPSSYEELPAAQHCYWADLLLPDQARLQAPSASAPGVDHAAAMAAAMRLHEQPPGSGGGSTTDGSQAVMFKAALGDFAVSKGMADLLASI